MLAAILSVSSRRISLFQQVSALRASESAGQCGAGSRTPIRPLISLPTSDATANRSSAESFGKNPRLLASSAWVSNSLSAPLAELRPLRTSHRSIAHAHQRCGWQCSPQTGVIASVIRRFPFWEILQYVHRHAEPIPLPSAMQSGHDHAASLSYF